MSKKIIFLLVGLIVLLLGGIVLLFTSGNDDWLKNATVDLSEYRPYVLNTDIDFTKDGNSVKYISSDYGWGGLEPKWRCTVGKESIVKLYIKDAKNTDLVVNVYGFGVFDYKNEKNQKITVFANGTELGVWGVGDNSKYSVKIPESVMVDNSLTLKFVIDKPYVSAIDSRPLGMAVRQMNIRKQFANKTKRKIGKWLKDKINNNL